jgi:hypothetical protein
MSGNEVQTTYRKTEKPIKMNMRKKSWNVITQKTFWHIYINH